jgi:hypothetical protein
VRNDVNTAEIGDPPGESLGNVNGALDERKAIAQCCPAVGVPSDRTKGTIDELRVFSKMAFVWRVGTQRPSNDDHVNG